MMEESLSTLRDWERFAAIPYARSTDEQMMDYDDYSDYSKLPNTPDVTIIVLAYNHELWIEECLESLLNQKTRYSYEILVSEDCSTDKTAEICKRYQAQNPNMIRLFCARHNYKGVGNGGVGGRVPRAVVGRSRYVMWCEGDDYWVDPEKIERQVSYLESHFDTDACAGRFNTYYLQEDRMDRSQETLKSDFVQQVFSNGFGFYHVSTLCVRQNAYKSFVDYARKIGASYDMNLLYSLELSKGIYVMPGIVSVYRRTGSGIWSACSLDSMRAQHHRTLMVNAKFSKFPGSIFMYAQLIAAYWNYARLDFYKKRDVKSILLATLRVLQYSFCHPLSVGYCAFFFAVPKIINRVSR